MRPTAKSRAIARAVKTWATAYAESHDYQTFAIDLMADLLHFCDANGVDFEEIYHMAETHYQQEGSTHE